MIELVAADIGGTHARFALAEVADGKVVRLGEPITLTTAAADGLDTTWRTLGDRFGRPLPRFAALAAASPHGAASGELTGDIWSQPPSALEERLGLQALLVLNDFGAVAHAVQHLDADSFRHLAGPDLPLPRAGTITVCGPGTGVGCAQLIRRSGEYEVIETEGGHIGFAPADAFEDALLVTLREVYGRVSVERVCAGPSIVPIAAQLAAGRGDNRPPASDRALWEAALNGSDALAAEALQRFCRILGGAAGDLVLAQGAGAVVIAGGLGLRLMDRLLGTGFAERFVAKGRFRELMERIPVKLVTHPQPGLFGAAAAFASRFS